MRIAGLPGIAPTGATVDARGAGKADHGRPSFGLATAPGDLRAPVGLAAAPLAGLDGLLLMQAVDERQERRRRQRRRADGILGRLEEIHLALLDDVLPLATLQRLHGELAQHREASDDPELEGLVREIEVRAAVEAAKLEMAPRTNAYSG